jgi:exopolysaccharide production protein ExoQ
MSVRPKLRRIGAMSLSRALETCFVVLAIYIFTNARLWPTDPFAIPDPTPVNRTTADTGTTLNYAINSAVFFVAFALALRRPRRLWRAATSDILLTALLGLALASMLWSDAPDIVFRRWVALMGTTVFGVYLHVRYTLEEQLRLVAWGLGISLVCSIILFSPSKLSGEGFGGIYENKNSLGRMMALSTIIFVLLALVRRPRVAASVWACLSFMLLIAANSSTALVVTLTLLSLIPVMRILSRDTRLAIGLGGIAILGLGVGLLLIASNVDAATAILGRDATLTGRTDLWQYITEMILRRPWLGYGYETFWLWELPWRVVVDEGAGWTAPNAHNGFLETALALGFVGLGLFIAGLLRGLVRAVKYLQDEHGTLGLWPVLYLCFLFLYNLTEVNALTRNTIVWALYVSALLAVAPKGDRRDRPAGRWRVRLRATPRAQVNLPPVGPSSDRYAPGMPVGLDGGQSLR